ncbi:MAG: histidine kinase, partial [Cyanobacteria bacterium J06600_6]
MTIILLGLFYRDRSINSLLTLGKDNNVALTQSFANTLWQEFAPFLTDTRSLSDLELKNHPKTALLNDAVSKQMRGLSVAKVKIYDLEGRTVFSTDPSQIGQDKSQSGGFIAAKSGKVSTQLDHRDSFGAITGNLDRVKVLSSYLPIYNRDNSQIQGVFELYNDVTPLVESIQKNQINMVLGTTVLFFMLYWGLFAVIKRADSIIDEQKTALLKSQKEYKQKADAEALAAE